jgi:hypothetical protein
MTYNRNQARPLLTKGEYDLFTLSLGPRIDELDRKELKRTIDRTRRARDKYRDLSKRQTITTKKRKGARGAASDANQRTKAKATIFTEALGRLEKRSDKLDAAEARAERARTLEQAEKPATPGPNRAQRRAKAKPKGSKGRDRFMSSSAQASNQAAIRAPQTRIAASRGAAGRRNQAKRDR